MFFIFVDVHVDVFNDGLDVLLRKLLRLGIMNVLLDQFHDILLLVQILEVIQASGCFERALYQCVDLGCIIKEASEFTVELQPLEFGLCGDLCDLRSSRPVL